MGTKTPAAPAGSRWIPAVLDSQGCPARRQPRHPCQCNTTICPCSSFRSASLVKTSQDGSPRWLCMTATAERMAGDAESCCAVVAIIQAGVLPYKHLDTFYAEGRCCRNLLPFPPDRPLVEGDWQTACTLQHEGVLQFDVYAAVCLSAYVGCYLKGKTSVVSGLWELTWDKSIF